ncbi:hypothetical protein Daus18300_005109 [Diaporthe australafricana]|uniref:Amidohydrolase-related domain-containing protein n=1 Tax=Diaporthe australafricana TaxID=127596 RepID=A0ABR3X3A9_9PEZI
MGSYDNDKDVLFPNGGWDTHHHIFEPVKFPYAENRHLTPPAATKEQYNEFKARCGISNSVISHGMSYGDDCTSLKAFIPELGGLELTRGIGIIDPQITTDEELLQMHRAGIRGVRVNLYRYKAMEDVALQKVALREHASRISRLNLPWSLTITTTRTDFWDELEPFIREEIVPAGVGLITDHFGLLKASSMVAPEFRNDVAKQPGFAAIMRLVTEGSLCVKLSAPYRISEDEPEYKDVESLVRAYVDANKERVLWGSDWPHTPRMKVRSHEQAMKETPFLEVDDLAWLRSLRNWLSNEEWDLMMVKNPERLFKSA